MVVDDVAARVLDALDEIRLVQQPSVGERPVGAGKVDLVHAQRSERQRRDRVLAVVGGVELEPKPLRQ